MILTDNIVRESGYAFYARPTLSLNSPMATIRASANFWQETHKYTWELEFYISKTYPQFRAIFNCGHGATNSTTFNLYMLGGNLTLSYNSSGTHRSFNHGAPAINTWHKFICSYERGVGMKTWLNTSKLERINADVVNRPPLSNAWGVPVRIFGQSGGGAGGTNWHGLFGAVRNIRIITGQTLLSDSDATKIYNGGNYLVKEGLPTGYADAIFAEFPCDQKNGQYVKDISGNDRHADIRVVSQTYTNADLTEGGDAWQYIP